MDNKLKAYVDNLFKDAPTTVKAYEVKEEILQNLKEKYSDLIKDGKSEEAAYNIAIESIGDLRELFAELQEGNIVSDNEESHRYAALKAVCAMIYVLAVVPLVMGIVYSSIVLAVSVPFVLIALATGLTVYNNLKKPKYFSIHNPNEKMQDIARRVNIRKSISGFLWFITVALYIIVSFKTMDWHLTWIIFLIAGAVECVLNIWFGPEGKR
jgi:uncharacterized membrane protein